MGLSRRISSSLFPSTHRSNGLVCLTPAEAFGRVEEMLIDASSRQTLMSILPSTSIPFAAQAIPFYAYLESGKLPENLIVSEYIGEQFVERLVHYILSVPAGSYAMAELGQLLEQLEPRLQIFFFKRLKETSPDSLKDFRPALLRLHVRVSRPVIHIIIK